MVWLVSGIMTFFGALVCAELASAFTKTGGVYLYLKEAYSSSMGFLWGWAMFWSMHSGIIAAAAVIFARYTGYFFPMSTAGIKATAVGVILILSAVNYCGVKQGSILQTVVTSGKVIAILLIIIAGLFAFGSWHMVTYSSEETVNPQKTIPRAFMLGTLVVTLCYILMNAVYLYILPLETASSSTRVAADAADRLLGSGGGALMSGLVIFSTFGSLNGIILCGPRVYYAMSRDGYLFRWIGKIHSRHRTPHRAILIQSVWSSILVITGSYRILFTRVVYTEWIFFALMAAGLFILRKRMDFKPLYKIRGYPYIPVIFIVAALTVVFNQINSALAESLFGLSFVLIGFPVYYVWTKRVKGEKDGGH